MKKFRKFIAPFVEGIIVGVFLGITLAILGIDMTGTQFGIVMVVIFISTSLASAVAQLISKGEMPRVYEWVYKHGENRIEVTAGLVEKLYINDELADKNTGVVKKEVSLKGKLNTGEEVIATIAVSGMKVNCRLLVGSEELKAVATQGV